MRAFVTGITGQDSWYLSQFLNEKGYTVYGLTRRTSQAKDLPPNVIPIEGDITDPGIIRQVEDIKPAEIYHLAAMSHVGESFRIPRTTFEINALGTLNILEAARLIDCKFYMASTSELFGNSPPPQNEETPFYPRSPYGVSKLAAYWLTVNYRESYDLFACNGILFNHESPRRGEDFVTRKVCKGVAEIKAGLRTHITLGNLNAKRDWGHARDFVKAMWLMMQQETPGDYVVATGESRSIRELLDKAFSCISIRDWTPYVETNYAFMRPADVDCLIGDSSKIRALGWEPEYSFDTLIEEMVSHEITQLAARR